ncbi:MAG: CAP domain-containing protein [Halobacteriales archaeon]
MDSRLRLAVLILLVASALVLAGCVQSPGEDNETEEDVDPSDSVDDGDGDGDGGDGGDGEDDGNLSADEMEERAEDNESLLYLERSNETVEIDPDLDAEPEDAEEANLSTECSTELPGYEYEHPEDARMSTHRDVVDRMEPREFEALVHDKVNSIRAAQGLDPLHCDDDLREIAIEHARDREKYDLEGSVNQENVTALQRYWLNEYRCDDAAENHFKIKYHENFIHPIDDNETTIRNMDQATREVVNRGWLQMDGDEYETEFGRTPRDLMLDDGNFTRSGVGVHFDFENATVYVTQSMC